MISEVTGSNLMNTRASSLPLPYMFLKNKKRSISLKSYLLLWKKLSQIYRFKTTYFNISKLPWVRIIALSCARHPSRCRQDLTSHLKAQVGKLCFHPRIIGGYIQFLGNCWAEYFRVLLTGG